MAEENKRNENATAQPTGGGMDVPVAIELVRKKVHAYHTMMNDVIDYIANSVPNTGVTKPTIDPATQYLQFYIDKDALMRMLKICTSDGFDSIGVFFGVDIDVRMNNKLTASFIGLDASRRIIKGHFSKATRTVDGVTEDDSLPGEENWPPPPETLTASPGASAVSPFLTLKSTSAEIDKFFTP